MRTSAEGPRFRAIVDELRVRIKCGELAAGDRVPSTREIVRRWDVAMATATRVLSELQREGLVRAVPGVGTVVEPMAPVAPPPSSTRRAPVRRSTDEPLTVTRIIAAGVAVADEEGLDALSMRRVAGELGVATMSLYRHVDDKDDLLLRMLDATLGEMRLPATPPDGWRARLELAARTFWNTLRRHPWAAPAMSFTRPQMLAGVIPYAEFVLSALAGLGLDHQTTLTAYITLLAYVRGTAMNIEQEAEAEAATGLDSETWMEGQAPALRALTESGRFPVFARVTSEDYDYDLDELFEFGLQRMLDGLAVLIGEAP